MITGDGELYGFSWIFPDLFRFFSRLFSDHGAYFLVRRQALGILGRVSFFPECTTRRIANFVKDVCKSKYCNVD